MDQIKGGLSLKVDRKPDEFRMVCHGGQKAGAEF